MWQRARSAVCFLLAGALSAAPADAQRAGRLSVEATFGPSFGRGGGLWRHRDGVALDGVLAWRAARLGSSFAVVAVGGGIEGPYAGDDSCLLAPGGGCVPDYPTFTSIGIFGGLEQQGRFGSARVVAGPAKYQARGGGRAFGAQGRVDLATPPFFHAAVVGSVRGGLIPRLKGERYRLVAFGVGLRLQ